VTTTFSARDATPEQRARVATATTFGAQGLLFTVLLTHLPQFTDKYHVSDGTVTLIVLMVVVLAGVGSLLSELLAGRTSSRTALRTGLLVEVGAAVVIGLAPELPLFLVGFAIYGIGLGAVDAAGNMQAVAVQHRYGRSIITSFHACYSAAAIVGALYVSADEKLNVSLPGSILPAAALILAATLIVAPHLLPAEADPAPEPSATGESAATARGLNIAVTTGPLLLLGLAMTCFWSVDSGVSNWSSLYLRDLLHAGNSAAALGYALYQATALFSRLTGDLAVRRIGAVTTVRIGAAIGIVGSVLVVTAPGPVVAILGFGLCGLGLPVVAPLCFSAAGAAVRAHHLDSTPQQEASAVDSVIARLNVFNYLGVLLGAVLIGAIASAANYRIGFIVSVLLAASMVFLARGFAPASAAPATRPAGYEPATGTPAPRPQP
jgi:MFS family permease